MEQEIQLREGAGWRRAVAWRSAREPEWPLGDGTVVMVAERLIKRVWMQAERRIGE